MMNLVGGRRTRGLSIIIPTFNEAANVAELVRRIDQHLAADPLLSAAVTEVIVVDDSTDDTAERVRQAATTSAVAVRCIQRDDRRGGLGGAVLVGMREANYDLCLVMDGDLQHPPEMIGALYERVLSDENIDVVVASRYAGGGDATGLASRLRRGVSLGATLVLKAMFPIRLRECSDPMTGFFLVDRSRVGLDALRPRGFKILFEMLARQRLAVSEVPFEFAARRFGESKASVRQGLHLAHQLLQFRFGRMSGFALVGAVGAIANIGMVWWFTRSGLGVLPATLIAAEVTIVANFLVQDRLVFGDLRHHARGFWGRFLRSFGFNNIEGLTRIALVVAVVDRGWVSATLATAIFLALAFLLRYVFHALVVYAPRRHPRGDSM